MTTYNFNTSLGQTLTFNPAADIISVGYPALDIDLAQVGANTVITVANVGSVTLAGVSVGQLFTSGAGANLGVAGGTLVLGDNTISTSLDEIANAPAAIATGDAKIWGFGGADVLQFTAPNGNGVIFGGKGITDTADGGDTITATATGNLSVYGNAGNDTITLGATIAAKNVSVWGGLDNDVVNGGGALAGSTTTIDLGSGDDSFTTTGNAGTVVVTGGSGADVLNLTNVTGDATVYGGTGVTDSTDGADTITIATGSAIVYGNAGADVISTGATAASKTLNIHAGIGNDQVTLGAVDAAATATVFGGTGDDIISTAAALGNVTVYGGNGVTDTTDGNDVFTLGNGNITLYANAGNDTINVNAVTLAANKTATIFTGVGNDVVNISGAHAATSKIDITFASGGTDIINYAAGAPGILTTVNGFEAADKVNVTLAAGDAADLVVSSGFIFNDNSGGASAGQYESATEEAFNFVGYAGDFNTTNFVINGGSRLITNLTATAATTLTGGATNDQLIAGGFGDTLISGGGNDKLTGGAGNDTIRLAAGALAGTISGGAGVDTIEFGTGAVAINNAFTNVTGIEALKFAAGNDHAVTLAGGAVGAQAAGITTINASALLGANFASVTASDAAYTNSLTFLGGAAADTVIRGTQVAPADNLSMGEGADIIRYGFAGLTSADTIVGGNGVDILQISDAATNLVDATFANKTTIENLTLQLNGGGDQVVTLASAAQAAGIVTVDASAQAGAGKVTVDASAYTVAISVTGGAAADTITGGTGNDTLNGGGGADSIIGGAGNDTIITGAGGDTVRGGAGDDTITLGAGSDRVIFENASNGVDTITGASFTAGNGNDIFDFKVSPVTFDAGVAETVIANTIATIAGAPAANGIFVFTNDAVGNAAALKAALDATALDTTNIGNRVIVWEIDPTNVGVGYINNADTLDNNSITVTQTANIAGFADQAAVSAFTAALTLQNFDLI